MATDYIGMSASRKYMADAFRGGGAIVGKNVTISSIDDIDGGHRITFAYTLDDGEKKESTLEVMDGKNGSDGKEGFAPEIEEHKDNGNGVYKLVIRTKKNQFETPNLIPELDLKKIIVDINLNERGVLEAKRADGSIKYISIPTVKDPSYVTPQEPDDGIEDGGDNTSGTENENLVSITSIEFDSDKDLEISYDGTVEQEFPTFEINYSTGELNVVDNGNNNVTFEINSNKNLEVNY